MLSSKTGAFHVSRLAMIGAFAASLLLVLMTCLPVQAFAYFSKPAVSISFGASSVSLAQGQSQTIGLSVSPMQEQQLPGCGMAICPDACNGLTTPDGRPGGCLNEAGWCTCGGFEYYTAYTQISVSSSNPYVARASASGSSLSIQALSPGTATITVYASLSKHVDSAASMTVQVSAPASSGSSSSGSSAGSGSSGSSGGSVSAGGGSGSGSGASAGGGVSVSAVGTDALAAAAAQVQEQGGDAADVEMEAPDGTKIIVAEATTAEDASAKLAEIAGTEGTVTFWSGGTMDSPDVSISFKGADLDPAGDLSFDPNVTVSAKGEGVVAELLSDVDDALVMDFAFSGDLPAPGEVYLRASELFEDGTAVNLYSFNEESHKFELAQEGIEITGGYAVFTLDHCSTWAVSTSDLAALELTPEEEAAADAADVDATTVNVHAQDGTPFIIGGVVAAVVVVVAIVGVVVWRRRRADAAAAAAQAEADALFGGAEAEGESSDEAAADVGDPSDPSGSSGSGVSEGAVSEADSAEKPDDEK